MLTGHGYDRRYLKYVPPPHNQTSNIYPNSAGYTGFSACFLFTSSLLCSNTARQCLCKIVLTSSPQLKLVTNNKRENENAGLLAQQMVASWFKTVLVTQKENRNVHQHSGGVCVCGGGDNVSLYVSFQSDGNRTGLVRVCFCLERKVCLRAVTTTHRRLNLPVTKSFGNTNTKDMSTNQIITILTHKHRH